MPQVKRTSLLIRIATALGAVVMLASCAHNPATGGNDVVLSTKKGEIEEARREYDEIIKYYGVYEDQSVQDYVNAVGQRVARASDLPDLDWHFHGARRRHDQCFHHRRRLRLHLSRTAFLSQFRSAAGWRART